MNDRIDLLKPTDVARRLGVSRSWLYAAAADARIPAVRLGDPGGPLRFVAADLEAWIADARAASQPVDAPASVLRRATGTGRG